MLRGEKFGGSFFKQPIAAKVTRGLKHAKAVSQEDLQKRAVRRRDGVCRFPRCGCLRFHLALHVAHLRHKGAGGNPKGDRSDAHRMILFCSARHRENRVALDRGTMRVRPLTSAGTAGPCAFDVDVRALFAERHTARAKWVEVAREQRLHTFEPFTPEQTAVLDRLRGMEL